MARCEERMVCGEERGRSEKGEMVEVLKEGVEMGEAADGRE